jgi:hypothetical protein
MGWRGQVGREIMSAIAVREGLGLSRSKNWHRKAWAMDEGEPPSAASHASLIVGIVVVQ